MLGGRLHWEIHKILSKMNKDLGQQIVHQKVQQEVHQKLQQKGHNDYVAHLIKRFVFTKLVECLW